MGKERVSKIDPSLAFDIREDPTREFLVWIRTAGNLNRGHKSYLTKLTEQAINHVGGTFYTATLKGDVILKLDRPWIEHVRPSRKLHPYFENYLPRQF